MIVCQRCREEADDLYLCEECGLSVCDACLNPCELVCYECQRRQVLADAQAVGLLDARICTVVYPTTPLDHLLSKLVKASERWGYCDDMTDTRSKKAYADQVEAITEIKALFDEVVGTTTSLIDQA